MDKVNKQELRRLIHEATESEMEWPIYADWRQTMCDDWASYVAAANPAAILSLLDELEKADERIRLAEVAAEIRVNDAVGRALTEHGASLAELEQYRKDAESLRGSCKALGEQNKHLTRRVKALARAVKWLAETGWGVARPKWLTAILAKEGGANG